jgi:hypothetical protein
VAKYEVTLCSSSGIFSSSGAHVIVTRADEKNGSHDKDALSDYSTGKPKEDEETLMFDLKNY